MTMRSLRLPLALLASVLITLSPVMAQSPRGQSRQEPPAPAPAPAPPSELPPPYEPQLLRLAEIMGALSYLRDLCGAKDGSVWRARMAALLEAEAQTEMRKERLAGAYNRGFRGFETTYRTCTPNAELLIDRYLDEGGRIARDVQNRFGGG
jgi:uncharacterized protein (TIGR02301 family)